jgi:hypothetical protein
MADQDDFLPRSAQREIDEAKLRSVAQEIVNRAIAAGRFRSRDGRVGESIFNDAVEILVMSTEWNPGEATGIKAGTGLTMEQVFDQMLPNRDHWAPVQAKPDAEQAWLQEDVPPDALIRIRDAFDGDWDRVEESAARHGRKVKLVRNRKGEVISFSVERGKGVAPPKLDEHGNEIAERLKPQRQANPWSVEGWSFARQVSIVRSLGVEKASQMAESAGSFLGSPRPGARRLTSRA